ncbi:MAG: efflux RND transporter periplasmic adaptor subunit [Spirochaetaceae bacterium]|jgi:membrane fusion protein (multidrug efflux system)|nr:efflux RND transporter periplasmic adaptor subunit [Spirochaetaceae bacterium]GMO19055.1 MAG: hypothetical protein Pg6A_05780 [Termitinemataceae bacterium]
MRYTIALFLELALLCSCAKNVEPEAAFKQVKIQVAESRRVPNELHGFGSLSFIKKIDVGAQQDARVGRLAVREGAEVRKGTLLAVLDNPQITLAVERAEYALSLAVSSLELARSALLEGEFNAQAQILSLEKSEDELAETWKAYYESERKFNAQQVLYLAGGVNEESMRVARFSLESEYARIKLAERDLYIRKIGFREQDLEAAGIPVPQDKIEKDRAFLQLATAQKRAEVNGAIYRLEAAKKELESAQIAYSQLSVFSPASGIIAARYLEEGEQVKNGDKLFTLIDSESLYASIAVQEADAFIIEKGMSARVSIDGTGSEYNGVVDLISHIADSQSFSFTVRILLPKEALTHSIMREGNFFAAMPESKELARPGMFARAAIRLGEDKQVITLKENALINKKNNEANCFVVQKNSLEMRKLKLGETIDGDYIIEKGLAAGERVVLHPDARLREGDNVNTVE